MVSTRRARNPVRHPHAACATAPPFRVKMRRGSRVRARLVWVRTSRRQAGTATSAACAPPQTDVRRPAQAADRSEVVRPRATAAPTARERAPARRRAWAAVLETRAAPSPTRAARSAPSTHRSPQRGRGAGQISACPLGEKCAARGAERGPGARRFGCVPRDPRDRLISIASPRDRLSSIANRRDRPGSIANRLCAPTDSRIERRSAPSVHAADVSEPHAQVEGLRTAGASAGSAASAVCRGGEDDGTRTRNHRRDRPVL